MQLQTYKSRSQRTSHSIRTRMPMSTRVGLYLHTCGPMNQYKLCHPELNTTLWKLLTLCNVTRAVRKYTTHAMARKHGPNLGSVHASSTRASLGQVSEHRCWRRVSTNKESVHTARRLPRGKPSRTISNAASSAALGSPRRSN